MTRVYSKTISLEPEAIARDIRATRVRIDRTVEALIARLAPRQLLQSARAAGRAGLVEAGGQLQRAARDRPVPLIASAATALLLATQLRRAWRGGSALARERPLLAAAVSVGLGTLLGRALSQSGRDRSRISNRLQ